MTTKVSAMRLKTTAIGTAPTSADTTLTLGTAPHRANIPPTMPVASRAAIPTLVFDLARAMKCTAHGR
jgi:hypothetical protein